MSFDDVEKVLVGRFMALEAFCCILMCFSCSLGFFFLTGVLNEGAILWRQVYSWYE